MRVGVPDEPAVTSPPPRVSIVLTTCDRPAETLRRAAASAWGQQAVAVELVVVDDSTRPWVEDDTIPGAIVRHTSGREGVNRARNMGLAHATGAWICFLDDDDELHPGFAAACLRAIDTSNLPAPVGAVVGCEERAVDRTWSTLPRAAVIRDGPLDAMLGIGALNGFFVPTSLLREAGGWPEDLRVAGLTDLYVRLRRLTSLEAVPEPLYIRHQQDDADRLSRQWHHRARAYEQTVRRNREVLTADRDLWVQWLVLRSDAQLRAGHWAPALRHVGAAFVRNPTAFVSREPRRYLRVLGRAAIGPHVWRWEQRRRHRSRAADLHPESPTSRGGPR